MLFPVPATAPVIPAPPVTVQLKVAFGSALLLFIIAFCPEQIVLVDVVVVKSIHTNLN
jgi:hypothetical protein